MSEIPRSVLGRIEYFEQHIPVWADDPAAIGLDVGAITEMTAQTGAARIAYNAAQAARSVSKSATVTQTAAVGGMLAFGTAIIATIKAYADISGDDQAVYAAAEIDPDNGPSPLAPPTPATDVAADLLNTGAIKLTWEGTVANGTFYSIWRRLDAETEYETLGSVSAKGFTDTSLPVGTPEANYYLITHRDEQASDASEPITVRFGVVNPNETASTGNSEGGMGLAA